RQRRGRRHRPRDRPSARSRGDPAVVADNHFSTNVVHTDVAGYHDLVVSLRDQGFNMCIDVTAVDYLTYPGRALPDDVTRERFEVVVNLLKLDGVERVRVRCQVPQGNPTVPTITDLYAG